MSDDLIDPDRLTGQLDRRRSGTVPVMLLTGPSGLDLPVHVADLPPGVALVVCSRVSPSEVLPGESYAAAVGRLGRAVAVMK